MSDYDKNVYYNPEILGLVIVDTLDEPDLSWEFNTFLVVQHTESGRLFYGTSSGCSCPRPFEEYHFDGPDDTDLEEITKASFGSFEVTVNNFPVPQHEINETVDKVKKLLKAK